MAHRNGGGGRKDGRDTVNLYDGTRARLGVYVVAIEGSGRGNYSRGDKGVIKRFDDASGHPVVHWNHSRREHTSNPKKLRRTFKGDARNRRLTDHQPVPLYHQTDPVAAGLIIDSQQFCRGSKGYVGGGIYFAASKDMTNIKAHATGTVLRATVFLGKSRVVDAVKCRQPGNSPPQYDCKRLKKEGLDSVHITGMRTGAEYVVYNFDQAVDIEYYSGKQAVTPAKAPQICNIL